MRQILILLVLVPIYNVAMAANTTQDLYLSAIESHFRFEMDTLKTSTCRCVTDEAIEYINKDSLDRHQIIIVTSNDIKQKPRSIARVMPAKIKGDTVSILVVQYGVSYKKRTYSYTRNEATQCFFVFDCISKRWNMVNETHGD